MADTTIKKKKRVKGVEGVTPQDRTNVIMGGQLFAIIALIVIWSILRSRRAAKAEA